MIATKQGSKSRGTPSKHTGKAKAPGYTRTHARSECHKHTHTNKRAPDTTPYNSGTTWDKNDDYNINTHKHHKRAKTVIFFPVQPNPQRKHGRGVRWSGVGSSRVGWAVSPITAVCFRHNTTSTLEYAKPGYAKSERTIKTTIFPHVTSENTPPDDQLLERLAQQRQQWQLQQRQQSRREQQQKQKRGA